MKPFHFKQFSIQQDKCAMKIGTDGVLLGAWATVENAQTIFDIGTGTGLIALMLAQRNTQVTINAIEIDEAAFLQARDNFKNSPFATRLNIIHQSIQTYANTSSSRYDLIISNPPFFIKNKGTNSNQKNRQIARQTNLLTHTELLDCVLKLLSIEGRFCVILPYLEGLNFIQQAKIKSLFCNKMIEVRGRIEKPIERLLLEFSRQDLPLIREELVIQKSSKRHDYTPKYINLTKDFYTIL